jgi:soluble lytic murein transglycosylase-like protein
MTSPFDSKHSDTVGKIRFYAAKHGIPADIGIWQMWQESRYKLNAVSHAGAAGIAQFMPATAERFGVNPLDIDSSLDGWGRYMKILFNEFKRWELALAGYNAGEGNVRKYGGIPPFQETQNYVKIIGQNANLKKAAGIAGLVFGVLTATIVLVKLSKMNA